MPTDKRWTEGFYAGVCSALACLDEVTTEYREIVAACGGMDLLMFARREDDSQYKNIVAAVRENAQRNRGTTDAD